MKTDEDGFTTSQFHLIELIIEIETIRKSVSVTGAISIRRRRRRPDPI